jgi:hypothetical protein
MGVAMADELGVEVLVWSVMFGFLELICGTHRSITSLSMKASSAPVPPCSHEVRGWG